MITVKTEITRTDEYHILFDPTIINAEWLADYSRVFSQADDVEDLAKDLSFKLMRQGIGDPFIEGFGNVKMLYKGGTAVLHWANGKQLEEKDYTKGIEVHLYDVDDDFDYNTRVEDNTQKAATV